MLKAFLLVSSLSFYSALALSGVCDLEQRKITKPDFFVELITYTPEKTKGSVIIVPPTGGTNLIDRSYGKAFCKNGFTAIILNHWTDDDELKYDLGIHERFYTRSQRAIRILIDDIASTSFIGIMGTSVGGIHSALAVSHYPEIQAAYIIVGGSDIAEITGNSQQGALITAWEKRQKMYGFKTRDEYINAVRKEISFTVKDLSKSGKSLGVVIGEKDTVVPVANQKKLIDLWKPETVVSYNFDHFLTIIFTWLFKTDDMIQFFDRAVKSRQ